MELGTIWWCAVTFGAGMIVGIIVGYLRLAQLHSKKTGKSIWEEVRNG